MSSCRSEVDNAITKDGSIKIWKRYKAEIVCQMIFDKFPFDTQTCDFKFHIRKLFTKYLIYCR